MSFRLLQHQLEKIKEIAVMSRNAEIDGGICHVMGMVLCDNHQLQMLILQYDEVYRERLEDGKMADVAIPPDLLNNRMEQRGDRNLGPSVNFVSVERVCIGDIELTTNETSGSMCSMEQWDKAALFTRFLLSGWNPAGIDMGDINTIYLQYVTFDGLYDAIPAFDTEAPIRFSMRPSSTCHRVELPVHLTVGSEYTDKLYFTDKESGEQHWVQINKVTLCDMWAEMMKTFDNPRIKEDFSPEELALHKVHFEEHFSQVCPKGTHYIVVEYECEEDISLQFYSKRWLDAKPIHTNSGMVFIAGSDGTVGKLGLKLKAAIIQEPVAPDTTIIEAELFQYYQTKVWDDIVID